jgi:hypothetical protein
VWHNGTFGDASSARRITDTAYIVRRWRVMRVQMLLADFFDFINFEKHDAFVGCPFS